MPLWGREGGVIGKAVPDEADELEPLLRAEAVDTELLQGHDHESKPPISGGPSHPGYHAAAAPGRAVAAEPAVDQASPVSHADPCASALPPHLSAPFLH